MPTTLTPTSSRKLSTKQVHLLKLVYKFRFVSPKLLSECIEADNASIYRRLQLLKKIGYLNRDFGHSYHLLGKSARYHLAPTAIAYLRSNEQIKSKALHRMYSNNKASEEFALHALDVLRLYLVLRKTNSAELLLLTQSEFSDLPIFPRKLPDLYLRGLNRRQDFMLELLPRAYFFVYEARVRQYLKHFLSEEWRMEGHDNHPTILLVCPDATIEQRLRIYLLKLLNSHGVDNLSFMTTTQTLLLAAEGVSGVIWLAYDGPKDRKALV